MTRRTLSDSYALLDYLLRPDVASRDAQATGLSSGEDGGDEDAFKGLAPEAAIDPALQALVDNEWHDGSRGEGGGERPGAADEPPEKNPRVRGLHGGRTEGEEARMWAKKGEPKGQKQRVLKPPTSRKITRGGRRTPPPALAAGTPGGGGEELAPTLLLVLRHKRKSASGMS